MRLFFGLQPDGPACLDIAAWRDRMLPPLDRPVPAANLHITLVFLGNVTGPQLDLLGSAVDAVVSRPVAITLEQLGYWPKPRILWVGTESMPDTLGELVRQVRHATRASGLPIESRRYQPHITLARNCRTPPPASAEQPCFNLDFDHFTLFESVAVRGGVRYDPIAEWTL